MGPGDAIVWVFVEWKITAVAESILEHVARQLAGQVRDRHDGPPPVRPDPPPIHSARLARHRNRHRQSSTMQRPTDQGNEWSGNGSQSLDIGRTLEDLHGPTEVRWECRQAELQLCESQTVEARLQLVWRVGWVSFGETTTNS